MVVVGTLRENFFLLFLAITTSVICFAIAGVPDLWRKEKFFYS